MQHGWACAQHIFIRDTWMDERRPIARASARASKRPASARQAPGKRPASARSSIAQGGTPSEFRDDPSSLNKNRPGHHILQVPGGFARTRARRRTLEQAEQDQTEDPTFGQKKCWSSQPYVYHPGNVRETPDGLGSCRVFGVEANLGDEAGHKGHQHGHQRAEVPSSCQAIQN